MPKSLPPAELHQIRTKDGLLLEGLLYRPRRKSKVAGFWVGGLTSRHSNNPKRIHAIAAAFSRAGFGFATFDHRGSGNVSTLKSVRGKRSKYVLGGTSFERFEHSVLDIAAVIRFLKKHRYRDVFLLGHSTGANKAAYYIWKNRGRGLRGVALLGPMSDIPSLQKKLGRKYSRAILLAEKQVRLGKGLELMPPSLVGGLWGAERFSSIAREGRREDTFPYYNPKRHFYWVKRLRTSVLVLAGSKDQYADRPVRDILEIFRREIPARRFSGAILPNASHGFTHREPELAESLVRWITSMMRERQR